MYFIVVKFQTKPDYTDQFMELVGPFTAATREEPGNLWFDWSRSVENPGEFILVEAFLDDDAAGTHVKSAHFKAGLDAMRPALLATPRIVSRKVDGDSWGEMGELQIG
ncbi:antibiotic biosynthesis monooxygenase [Arthrobacter livingstonensis]|uniref:Antibiotic biosynthesis monooxygenase n=1 Tax=Arthrobacter livingstonensis TaxID=670078 RepID=A0A2V5L4V0_9MICC|nr:putative quinol monooxygenase [Arthrobacter livingstonensis]PYI64723.1 antibiotic biosynthesis monooxygenase [Arthrobacter livingstonensis]